MRKAYKDNIRSAVNIITPNHRQKVILQPVQQKKTQLNFKVNALNCI